jgi:hypothetical protein
VAFALVLAGCGAGSPARSRPPAPVNDPALLDVLHAPASTETISVGASSPAPAIAKGFLGLSIEYQSVAVDAGPASDPDQVMDQLIANLNPGQRPVIRIGGDSTDHTWYPVRGVHIRGLTYALTPAWLASVARLARSTDAKLILGIDLEVNSPTVAGAEATALLQAIGSAHILAWEVGNEPNLYSSFPWYVRTAGDPSTGVYTRPRDYSFGDYLNQFNAEARALPDIALAGPALGSPVWMKHVGQMIGADREVRDITYHAYPTNCFAAPGNRAFPSVADLLSRQGSDGLAAAVAGYAAQARAAGRNFRVDELNSSACGGTSGVSDTFASALWVTDTLFAMASRGVTGVNIQDFNSGRYKPFGFSQVGGRWVAQVEPLYYGMALFVRAAPAGSQLLSVGASGADTVRAWAAQTPADSTDHGARTVTLINDHIRHAVTVTVRVPGASRGTLIRMSAPAGAAAKAQITLAGSSYGSSTSTGKATGRLDSALIRPEADGSYRVSLPAASAALVTFPR